MRPKDGFARLEGLPDLGFQDLDRGHGFRETGGEHSFILDNDRRGVRLHPEGEVRVIEAGQAGALHFGLEVVPQAQGVLEEGGFPPLHGLPGGFDGAGFRFQGLEIGGDGDRLVLEGAGQPFQGVRNGFRRQIVPIRKGVKEKFTPNDLKKKPQRDCADRGSLPKKGRGTNSGQGWLIVLPPQVVEIRDFGCRKRSIINTRIINCSINIFIISVLIGTDS